MFPGWLQILLVVLLIVLLFGRGKISELMGDVAKGIRSFKSGLNEEAEAKAEAEAEAGEDNAQIADQSESSSTATVAQEKTQKDKASN